MKKLAAVLVLAVIGLSSCKKEETATPSVGKESLEMTGRNELGVME